MLYPLSHQGSPRVLKVEQKKEKLCFKRLGRPKGMVRVPLKRAMMRLIHGLFPWKATLKFLCQFSEREIERGLVCLEQTYLGSLF